MPQYRKGNMFVESSSVDIILATSNSYIKQNGELVMGGGAAKSFAEAYPHLPKMLGQRLADKHLEFYGVCIIPMYDMPFVGLGVFQTKTHWRDPSELTLISRSAELLICFATIFDGVIAVNYPGIGLGKRSKEEVQPIVDSLPDNVWVYEYSV